MVATWQIELARLLLEMGQSHLFEHWAEPGVDDDEKKCFFEQVRGFFWVAYGIRILDWMEISFFIYLFMWNSF
jgi:hypothetical protein